MVSRPPEKIRSTATADPNADKHMSVEHIGDSGSNVPEMVIISLANRLKFGN